MELTQGLLRKAFMCADSKSTKRYWQLDWIITLLGSGRIKNTRKMLVKSNPGDVMSRWRHILMTSDVRVCRKCFCIRWPIDRQLTDFIKNDEGRVFAIFFRIFLSRWTFFLLPYTQLVSNHLKRQGRWPGTSNH